MGQSPRRSEDCEYHGDYSHPTGHLVKTGLHPKLLVKLPHLGNVSKGFDSFLFQTLLTLRIYHRNLHYKIVMQGLFCPHQGSDLGAQWEPSGLVRALAGEQPCLRCGAAPTVLSAHLKLGSNANLLLQLERLAASRARALLQPGATWTGHLKLVRIFSWTSLHLAGGKAESSRDKPSSQQSLCTQHIPDLPWSLAPCQGLDSAMLLIRHKTTLFLSKGSGIKLRQAIYSNRNQGITWEFLHGRILSKNRERKEMWSHQLLLLLHHNLSYFIIFLWCSREIPHPEPLSQAGNSVQDVKTSLKNWEPLGRASPQLGCFTALTSASAETEHKTLPSAHKPQFPPMGKL